MRLAPRVSVNCLELRASAQSRFGGLRARAEVLLAGSARYQPRSSRTSTGGAARASRPNPEAYAFPNARGGRLSRQRVGGIVSEAAELASERVATRGMPPLPRTTPHTLRRTYISIALLANRFDVLWVMGQVGHADSKMTLDVYAQLQQRVKREHGMAFDRLVDQAREQLYGTEP